MVVIADDNGVESLAGRDGRRGTGCDEATTDVLIECALFDPAHIAQTGRKLGIVSDARYRFERGVDPEFTVPGLELATRLVLDLCGGEASEISVAGALPEAAAPIDFPLSEVERLTGVALDPSDIQATLEELGFALAAMPGNAGHIQVRAPSWRPDIEGKADLVEEVIRLAGLDRVTPTPLERAGAVAGPVLTLLQRRVRGARGRWPRAVWSRR